MLNDTFFRVDFSVEVRWVGILQLGLKAIQKNILENIFSQRCIFFAAFYVLVRFPCTASIKKDGETICVYNVYNRLNLRNLCETICLVLKVWFFLLIIVFNQIEIRRQYIYLLRKLKIYFCQRGGRRPNALHIAFRLLLQRFIH